MNQKFDTELSLVIGTITNTKSFINHALQSDSEGGSINMCRAFEEWQEECIQKGIATGIQQGIQSSRLRPLNLSPSQIRTCGFPAYGSS